MQETPNDCISFMDMEKAAAANDGAPAQGTAYANMGIRNYDESYLPKCHADHEAAQEQGSKH